MGIERSGNQVSRAVESAGLFPVEEKSVDIGTNGQGPTVLLSHPTGNQNVRNVLRSLVEHEMLAEFWTSISWDPLSRWNRLISDDVKAQLARRSFCGVPARKVRTLPWREIVRLGARSTPLEKILCARDRPFSSFGMYRHFDRRVAHRLTEIRPNVVYTYETAANQTFANARKLGITTIYEKDSSYWKWVNALFAEEAERNPEFANLLGSLDDSVRHLEWKEEELRLADHVIVPSELVRSSLAGVVPDERIHVLPFGAPEIRPLTQFNLDSSHPLKVLFVGNLGQHKGIGYLLEAMDMVGTQVELTLVGRRIRPNARVDEACRHWRWHESLPHAQVLDAMQQADVLVLPSLSEGCALVVLEALACGLPVIVTPNTGSLAFVCDRREGFVVPICNAQAIAERLEVLHRDREMLAEMSRRAQVTAAENSWENYRASLASAVRRLAWH